MNQESLLEHSNYVISRAKHAWILEGLIGKITTGDTKPHKHTKKNRRRHRQR